ncbi:MAG TPA: hypothetical protein VF533_14155 [Solirubrobacteraceae bacterium]|jgi:hypothetical protein
MIGRSLILAALALTAAAAPPTAHAQSGETDSGGTEYRVPMETKTIYTVLDLRAGDRAPAVYRALIPRGYAMPARPQVALYLTEPNVPRALPGQPYNDYSRWIEGPVAIKVALASTGEEGYFPLAMPVSSRFEYDLGRAAGLPKILVEGAMQATPDGAEVTTKTPGPGGRPAVRLRFHRASVTVSDEAQRFAHNRYKLFALLPALRGPDLFFTKFTPEPVTPDGGTAPLPAPALPSEPEPGMVDYEIEPDLDALDGTLPDLFALRGASLADLVETRAMVPGLYWDLPQVLRLRSGDIGDGGGYDGVAPGPPGQTPAAPARRCASRRVVRITLPGRRARRARHARVRIDGRPFRRVRVRHGRLRLDLTGLPKGRFRFTVRARIRGHGVVKTTRTYRTCAHH